jgi:hypothetical protein
LEDEGSVAAVGRAVVFGSFSWHSRPRCRSVVLARRVRALPSGFMLDVHVGS